MPYPGLLYLEPLSLQWSPADPYLHVWDTQTLKGRSGSVSVVSLGTHNILFEPSKCLWWVWQLILNVISSLLPSCCSFYFALGRGISFFGGIQHSPVDGCSVASCNFGVLAEDECMSFYSMWKENGGGLIWGSRHICWSGYLRFFLTFPSTL